MNDLISAAYSERLRRVCDHIERHLDEPLSIDTARRFIFTGSLPSGAGFRSIAISSGCVCAARHGGWRLTRRIKLSISRWMPGFRIRSRSHVLSKPRLVKARAGFGNRRTGWPGTSAFLNLRYRSSMSWT